MIVVNGETYKFMCRMHIKDSYEDVLKDWEEGSADIPNEVIEAILDLEYE